MSVIPLTIFPMPYFTPILPACELHFALSETRAKRDRSTSNLIIPSEREKTTFSSSKPAASYRLENPRVNFYCSLFRLTSPLFTVQTATNRPSTKTNPFLSQIIGLPNIKRRYSKRKRLFVSSRNPQRLKPSEDNPPELNRFLHHIHAHRGDFQWIQQRLQENKYQPVRNNPEKKYQRYKYRYF